MTLNHLSSRLCSADLEQFHQHLHSFKLLKVDDAVEMLVELLEVSAAEVRAETIQCHGSYV